VEERYFAERARQAANAAIRKVTLVDGNVPAGGNGHTVS
jgi:hypothetical protein